METTVEATPQDIKFAYAYKPLTEDGEKYRIMMVDALKTTYPDIPVLKIDLTGDNRYLMVERMVAYAYTRRQVRGNLIFLDTDIVAMRPADLGKLFGADFDVGLVGNGGVEPYILMPYCGGMIFSKDTDKAQEWFDLSLKAANRIPEGMLSNGWWLDQLGMAYAVEHITGLKVMQLPTELFNFVPNAVQATKAFFVHLKGPRKHLMRQYYNCVKKTDYTGF